MRPSIRTLAVLLGLLGALVVASAVERFLHRKIQIPAVEPGNNSSAALAAAFPDRSSQAVVTLRVPLASLRTLIDRAVPSEIGGEYAVPDTHGLGGIKISPQCKRGELTLEPVVGQAPAAISAATQIQGPIGVSAFRWITVGQLKSKSPRFSETAHFAADVRGTLTPGIDAQWRLTHAAQLSVEVKQAELKVLGLFSIDAKKDVQAAADRELPPRLTSALNAVSDQLPIRAEVEKAWRALFRPIQVGSGLDAQVLLTPTAVRLQSLSFDDPNYLTVRAALDGTIQTTFGGQPPRRDPTALPDLVPESAIDPKFRLLLPVGIELSRANDLLARDFAEKQFAIQNATVRIRDAALYANGGDFYIKLDVQAETKRPALQAEGTIYLKCNLRYDAAAAQLRLANVEFSAETKSTLQDIALWLLSDEICRRIESGVKINVGKRLEQLRGELNERFAAVELVPGVKLKPRFDTVTFEGVHVADNWLIVGFDVAGEVACEIELPQ